jgi:hypothetical protein
MLEDTVADMIADGDDSPGSGAATPIPSIQQEPLKIAIPPPGHANPNVTGQTLNERAKEK